jgi:hypothetical protein
VIRHIVVMWVVVMWVVVMWVVVMWVVVIWVVITRPPGRRTADIVAPPAGAGRNSVRSDGADRTPPHAAPTGSDSARREMVTAPSQRRRG